MLYSVSVGDRDDDQDQDVGKNGPVEEVELDFLSPGSVCQHEKPRSPDNSQQEDFLKKIHTRNPYLIAKKNTHDGVKGEKDDQDEDQSFDGLFES